MRKRIGLLCLFVFFFPVGNAFGATFSETGLFTDYTLDHGYRLIASATIQDSALPVGDADVKYTWNGTPYDMFASNWMGLDMYDALVATGGDISSYQTTPFLFTADDGTFPAASMTVTAPYGFRQLSLSTNFHITTPGINPTVSWSNDEIGLDNYRVRVFSSTRDILWDSGNLPYGLYGPDPEYSISGYTLTPGETYWLRVEARDGIPTGQDGFWAFNRSSVWLEYSVPIPVPGAIWLLGSGLIGLVGVRRRYRND